MISLLATFGVGCARWMLDILLACRLLPQAVVDGEVVELGQVFVHAKDLLVLYRRLHLCLRRIALLLLLNKFLNFRSVQARGRSPVVFDLACLNHALHLGFNVAVSQVLLLKQELRVFPSQRGIVEGCLRRC